MGGTDADLVGATLGGRYRLERLIGVGGMGAVYQARQLDLGRDVAVKVLVDCDPEALARFRREASATSELRSPHVVSVFDFQVPADGPPFLVMELLPGRSLAALRLSEPAISVERAIAIGTQLLAALEAAHRAGIIHRDVKPSNIWLVSGPGVVDLVKVLDFGIAKRVDNSTLLTETEALLGTPGYLSPEQLRGLPADARSDIHAVGVILFELIAGYRPWKGEGVERSLAIVQHVPPLLHLVTAGVPPKLSEVVARALHKNPNARFATADEMRQALLAVTAPVAAPAPATARLFWPFFLGTVVIALLGGAAAVLIGSRIRRDPAPTDVTQAPGSVDASPPGPGVASSTPEPSASTGPPVDASAPPAKANLKVCQCHSQYNAFICTKPLPPICECLRPDDSDRVCPKPLDADGRCRVEVAPGLGAYGGVGRKSGQPCSGFGRDSEARPVPNTQGKLSCQSCYGNETVMGVEGAACAGVDSIGTRMTGRLVCRSR